MDDRIQQLRLELGNDPNNFELRVTLAERLRSSGEWHSANRIMLEAQTIDSIPCETIDTEETIVYITPWIGFEQNCFGYDPVEHLWFLYLDFSAHETFGTFGNAARTLMTNPQTIREQLDTLECLESYISRHAGTSALEVGSGSEPRDQAFHGYEYLVHVGYRWNVANGDTQESERRDKQWNQLAKYLIEHIKTSEQK